MLRPLSTSSTPPTTTLNSEDDDDAERINILDEDEQDAMVDEFKKEKIEQVRRMEDVRT